MPEYQNGLMALAATQMCLGSSPSSGFDMIKMRQVKMLSIEYGNNNCRIKTIQYDGFIDIDNTFGDESKIGRYVTNRNGCYGFNMKGNGYPSLVFDGTGLMVEV